MRTTIEIDDKLFARVQRHLPGCTKKQIIDEALRRLLSGEAARKLALAGGTQPQLEQLVWPDEAP